MDYDFMILNNAFLIHRPGIKTNKYRTERERSHQKFVYAQNKVVRKYITPELTHMYGTRKGCEM